MFDQAEEKHDKWRTSILKCITETTQMNKQEAKGVKTTNALGHHHRSAASFEISEFGKKSGGK